MATKVLFPPASFPSPLLQASNILPGPHSCLSCTTFLGCSLSVTSLLHYLSQDTYKDKYPRTPHSPPLGSLTPRSFLSSQQKCHGEEDHALPQQVWSSLSTTSYDQESHVVPSCSSLWTHCFSFSYQQNSAHTGHPQLHKGKQEAPGQTRNTDVQGKVEGEKAQEGRTGVNPL